MSPRNPQAIAGVSAGVENRLMIIYPSVSCTALGRLLGWLYNSIPLKINGLMISHLLFPLPTSPIVLMIYLCLKMFGKRYVLTNRAVKITSSLGRRLYTEVPLPAIADIEIEQSLGQRFYRAADLVLYDSAGEVLARLDAVPRAEIFRKIILEARDAQAQTATALAAISSRKQPA